jgi:cytochrome c peroxidase
MTPELAQQRFAQDPSHPLFRAVDSDDGAGRDYSTLLAFALFRVNIPLHPDVRVVGEPQRRTIKVLRGVPSLANLERTAPFVQDGREATLQEQASGAILDHMQPARRSSPPELDALAAFEKTLFYPLRLRSMRDDDPVPRPPQFSVPIQSQAAARGKIVFDRHCQRCHSGETGDQPLDPEASRFVSVFVSEANVPRLPMQRLAFKQDDGSWVETVTPDPGRAAITGRLADLNAFDTPQLRGVKHTAPYFHDNSAPTLDAVIEHYNATFQFRILAAEKDDLLAYLELL